MVKACLGDFYVIYVLYIFITGGMEATRGSEVQGFFWTQVYKRPYFSSSAALAGMAGAYLFYIMRDVTPKHVKKDQVILWRAKRAGAVSGVVFVGTYVTANAALKYFPKYFPNAADAISDFAISFASYL